jgi:hypothetical protein
MGKYLWFVSWYGNAVKGFWALWDDIYNYVLTTSDFSVILDG